MPPDARYVVIGAGALGGLLAAKLTDAGRATCLVARGDAYAAISQRGIVVATPNGTTTTQVPVVDSCAAADIEPGDVVILAVMSQHTPSVLAELCASAPAEVAIACAQNGVANEPAALRHFRQVYGMCAVLAASHLRPGEVVQHSSPRAGLIDVGRFPSGIDGRAEQICADLEAAGFLSAPAPQITGKKYRKLLGNLANALDALGGMEARRTELRPLLEQEAKECFAAAGIEAEDKNVDAARWAEGMTITPVPGHEHPGSSSSQSLARAAGSIETPYLNGEIVLLGRLHGVPTPVNEALLRLASEAARRRLPPGSMDISAIRSAVDAARCVS